MGVRRPALLSLVHPLRDRPGAAAGLAGLASALVLLGALSGCRDAEPPRPGFYASTLRVPFHRSDCNRVRRIPEDKLEVFEARAAAVEAGHTPCPMCKP